MILTPEQQALLDGKEGDTMAKVMKTLVMYGEAFGAERMVPVTGEYGHTVLSFGLGIMKPVQDLFQQLIDAGLVSKQKFTADPRPMDPAVPKTLIDDLIFKKFMYSEQDRFEKQLRELGLKDDDSYTCTSYLVQVGNTPKKGEVLSWAESSAVVYANSVLGARCNRNSGIIELMGSIAGFVPEFGFLTDEGRKADWVIEVKCSKKPDAQLLGSAIGMKVMDEVPYVKGLNEWIGTELNEDACTYLKDFGAATASNGSVGLYHIADLTPEAKELGESLIKEGAKTYVITDTELETVKAAYPVIWKNPNGKPQLCFNGCPHMTLKQLEDWTANIEKGLKKNGLKRVSVPTVFTASVGVLEEFEKTPYAEKLKSFGVTTSPICALMYMNNPLCKKKNVITSSNKLRTYTSAKFYSEEEILSIITNKEARL